MHGHCSRLSLPVRAGAAFCWCGLLILAGCGGKGGQYSGKLIPVQGKVIMADGKPLSSGRVTFVPIDADAKASIPPPGGHLGEDGSYTLLTQGKPGAPPGKYRAVLVRGSDRKAWFAVPSQYLSQKKSPLEREVAEGKPAGYYDLKLQAK